MPSPERKQRALEAARTLDLQSAAFLEHEFETWKLLRDELPIAHAVNAPLAQGVTGAWVLTRYDDVDAVLRNPADFSSQIMTYPMRPWIPQAIDPPQHTGYRRVLNPWFSGEEMAKLEPHLERYADQLLDAMLAKDEFDFVADFADPFPTVIFCELAGFPREDYPQIMAWKNTLMHANDGHSRGAALARAKARELDLRFEPDGSLSLANLFQVQAATGIQIYGYLTGLIEQRRQRPGGDLVSKLLVARYEGERPLTQEEIEDTLFLLFMAGLDTVASVLGLIVKGFAEDPAKRREFLSMMDEPTKVMPAIEELVRIHAIVTVPRRATRELLFQGERFAENEVIACPTQAANRDPAHFPNPDTLVFDRKPNRHMGFGRGPHRCLGIHLARRELRVALQAFHRGLPDYRLHASRKPELFGGMKGVSSLWLEKT